MKNVRRQNDLPTSVRKNRGMLCDLIGLSLPGLPTSAKIQIGKEIRPPKQTDQATRDFLRMVVRREIIITHAMKNPKEPRSLRARHREAKALLDHIHSEMKRKYGPRPFDIIQMALDRIEEALKVVNL